MFIEKVLSTVRLYVSPIFIKLSNRSFNLLFLIGGLVSIVSMSPGLFSPDSFNQYSQAVAHSYGATHAPIMSILMHYLSLYFDPYGIFIIHQVLYWLIWWIFLNCIFQTKRVWHFCLVLFPSWFLLSVTIWKDTEFLICLFGAFTLSLVYLKYPKKIIVAPILLALCYATMIRFNAVFAIFPFVWSFIFVILPAKRLVIKFLSSLVLCILFFVATFTVQQEIYKNFSVRYEVPLGFITLWDIANIYHVKGQYTEPLPPFVYCNKENACNDWIENYDPLLPKLCWNKGIDCTQYSGSEVKEMLGYWWNCISQNPQIYFLNRIKTGWALWASHKTILPWHDYHYGDEPVEEKFKISPLGELILSCMYLGQKILDKFYLYQYILYFCLSIFLIFKLTRKFILKGRLDQLDLHTKVAVISLGAILGGIINAFALWFIAGAEYRYIVWSILIPVLVFLIFSSARCVSSDRRI